VENVEEDSDMVDELWNTVPSNFEKISVWCKAVMRHVHELGDAAAGDIEQLQVRAEEIDTKVQLLKHRVGQDLEASDGEALNVWEALTVLREEMLAIEARLSQGAGVARFEKVVDSLGRQGKRNTRLSKQGTLSFSPITTVTWEVFKESLR